ncbi:hypothetical protein ACWGNR_09985 [Streptomyces althioticus]
MKREELLAEARKHVWAAWQLSSEELAAQAVVTLHGMGMLVPEGGAAELEKLRSRVAELEAAQESPLAFAEKLDAKSLDNFLIALASATEHEPQDAAIARVHELISSYREGGDAR